MTRRTFPVLVIAAIAAAGCGRAASAPSSPSIRLDTINPQQAAVEIGGISRADLDALSRLGLSDEEWPAILRVTVRPAQTADAPPVVGRYVVGDSIRFIPSFPFDPGRDYEVSFDPSRLRRSGMPAIAAARAVVSLPDVDKTPSTVVAAVYPSGDVIPENQLRMYVQFSGPMGQQGGLNHVVWLDQAGRELTGAVLPLDTDLWSADRTAIRSCSIPAREARDPAEPHDGAPAACRGYGHACRESRLARCPRRAAEVGVQTRISGGSRE